MAPNTPVPMVPGVPGVPRGMVPWVPGGCASSGCGVRGFSSMMRAGCASRRKSKASWPVRDDCSVRTTARNGRALLQLAGDLAKRREIGEAKEALVLGNRGLHEPALLEIAEVVEPKRGIHREDVAMAVALRRARVVGRRDGHRAAARHFFRRIEWQFRHSDRFEDTTSYGGGNNYSSRSRPRLEVRLPQRPPEVRRPLRRQVAEVERHQIELAFIRHASEARGTTCLAVALKARRRTKLIEQ